MDKYAQILKAYTTRKLLMLIVLSCSLVTLMPLVIGLLSDSLGIWNVVFSAMILAFCAALLGGHVKQQIATPEASLVPNFRKPHLIFAGALFLLPLSLYCLIGGASDLSVPGVIAVGMFVWLSSFHVGAQTSRIGTLGILIVFSGVFVPEVRALCIEILQGQLPAIIVCLLSIEAAAAAMLFHHLATLSEEDPDYGMVMPLNPWDMRAAATQRRNRAQLQRSSRIVLSRLSFVSRKLDEITARRAKTQRQRIALLQMSADWPINWKSITVMILVMELGMVLLAGQVITTTTAEELAKAVTLPIMLSLMLSFFPWLPNNQRWSRLGYESLRPATRAQWVRENAWAMALNVLQLQAAWCCVQILLLLVFLQDFWNSPVVPNVILFLAGAHLLLFGAGAWTASLGSMAWKMICAMSIFGFMQPAWLAVSPKAVTFSWQVPVVAVTCGLVGLGLMAAAYRRWCRIDLN